MDSKLVGIYKEKEANGSISVMVHNGVMHVPECRYREQGYEPPIEKLPWKEEYEASLKGPQLPDIDDETWKRIDASFPRNYQDKRK